MSKMCRQRCITISKGHPLYTWCDTITAKANNLANAVRFRQRQVLSASGKAESEWTDNECAVLEEILGASSILAEHGKHFSQGQKTLGYTFLDGLLKITRNPDYYAEGLPVQTAQHVIRQCCTDMKSFFSGMAAYKDKPSAFTGRPALPGYKRKGGHCACTITNQDAVFTVADGIGLLKLPLTKIRAEFGSFDGNLSLSEVKVIPNNGTYTISIVYAICDNDKSHESVSISPSRIAAIDFGVNNLIASVNNCGLPSLLYSGSIPKSINRFYNKKLAGIMREEMAKPDCPLTRDKKPRFVPTEESMVLTLHRNFAIDDFMHKTAKHFITWCVENRIDTVVAGVNKLWKQEVNLGHKNNQEFVQIPFSKLRMILAYLCAEHGIRYVEQEESYTSKASFCDMDPIPVYRPGDETVCRFSG